jgi:hypothetical protein
LSEKSSFSLEKFRSKIEKMGEFRSPNEKMGDSPIKLEKRGTCPIAEQNIDERTAS